jgi:hypothetical protein
LIDYCSCPSFWFVIAFRGYEINTHTYTHTHTHTHTHETRTFTLFPPPLRELLAFLSLSFLELFPPSRLFRCVSLSRYAADVSQPHMSPSLLSISLVPLLP